MLLFPYCLKCHNNIKKLYIVGIVRCWKSFPDKIVIHMQHNEKGISWWSKRTRFGGAASCVNKWRCTRRISVINSDPVSGARATGAGIVARVVAFISGAATETLHGKIGERQMYFLTCKKCWPISIFSISNVFIWSFQIHVNKY